ncbi:MAG TPA: rhomboid family intramembrane serine protease [Bryobacteraceae bacterium]|jgi:rhomboid protease GluP|nr:rhomboid family intramembrane serine protease [Bryobacteraceae bacterium]
MDKRRMCPNCRAFVTSGDKVCPYCQAPIGARAVEQRNAGEILGGLIPHARFTTIVILLINTALYLAEYLSPQSGITRAGESLPAFMMQGEWWRLITAGFLHNGILHILMNSWVLFDLGAEVETLYGTSRLIVFYFVGTVTGFSASSHIAGGHISVGSSAGIFGLIGAMLAFGFTDRSSLGMQVKSLYTRWVIYGLVLSFLPGVDFWAHVGGFSGGFIAGWLASTPRARMMWKEPLLRALAGICIAVTVVAFGMMYLAMTRTT